MTSRRSFLDGQPVIVQLFLLLGLVMACAFIFTVLGMMLVKPLYGISGADILLKQMSDDPDNFSDDFTKVNAMKLIQLMSSVGLFLVPALIFAYTKRPGGDYLQTRTRTTILWLVVGCLLTLCASPFVGFLYEINQRLNLPGGLMETVRAAEDQAQALTKLFLQMPTTETLLYNLFLIALLPAIAEEFFFRGVVQKIFYEGSRNVHVAVWSGAALFSFIHFQFLGFLPRMFLGVILGYLFAFSGSIWVPIVAHAINNGSQVVAAYLYQRGMIKYNIEENEAPPFVFVIASALITAALFYFIYKRRVHQAVLVSPQRSDKSDPDDLPFV